MFRCMRSWHCLLSGLAAAAALLIAVGPAAAQQRASAFRIPPDARGYQTVVATQEYLRARATVPAGGVTPPSAVAAAPRPYRPAASASLEVTVIGPAPAPQTTPVYVDIRGPDGELRRFPLEGGPEALQSRVIVVRPGESATIQLVFAARGR
jgi:hypothetical protein